MQNALDRKTFVKEMICYLEKDKNVSDLERMKTVYENLRFDFPCVPMLVDDIDELGYYLYEMNRFGEHTETEISLEGISTYFPITDKLMEGLKYCILKEPSEKMGFSIVAAFYSITYLDHVLSLNEIALEYALGRYQVEASTTSDKLKKYVEGISYSMISDINEDVWVGIELDLSILAVAAALHRRNEASWITYFNLLRDRMLHRTESAGRILMVLDNIVLNKKILARKHDTEDLDALVIMLSQVAMYVPKEVGAQKTLCSLIMRVIDHERWVHRVTELSNNVQVENVMLDATRVSQISVFVNLMNFVVNSQVKIWQNMEQPKCVQVFMDKGIFRNFVALGYLLLRRTSTHGSTELLHSMEPVFYFLALCSLFSKDATKYLFAATGKNSQLYLGLQKVLPCHYVLIMLSFGLRYDVPIDAQQCLADILTNLNCSVLTKDEDSCKDHDNKNSTLEDNVRFKQLEKCLKTLLNFLKWNNLASDHLKHVDKLLPLVRLLSLPLKAKNSLQSLVKSIALASADERDTCMRSSKLD